MKQYMIDPYYEDHPEEKEPDIEVEAVMRDDVTEKERLDRIKKNIQH